MPPTSRSNSDPLVRSHDEEPANYGSSAAMTGARRAILVFEETVAWSRMGPLWVSKREGLVALPEAMSLLMYVPA